MLTLANKLIITKDTIIYNFQQKVDRNLKKLLVSCDAWFLVLLAVLLTLAFTINAGLAIWCVVYKGKKFTGIWKWAKTGTSVMAECK